MEKTEPIEVDLSEEPDVLKEQGNAAFKAKRFGEAIEYYTQALGAHNNIVIPSLNLV